MLIHTNTYKKKPYIMRVWKCCDYEEHWHSDMEIYICLGGKLCIRVEGEERHLAEDDVLLVAGNESHEIVCDDPHAVAVIIAFGYALLGNEYATLQDGTFNPAYFNLHDDGLPDGIKHPLMVIKEVALKCNENTVPSEWRLRGSLYEVAAYLGENMQTTISKTRKMRAKHLENMYGVLEYITGHYREKITLEQAAALTGYDKSYFSNQFSNATGMPFHRYLNRYRLSVACKYLEDKTLSATSVAELSGFASLKMMSRLFRDTLGITPTQYRNLPSEKKNVYSL